MSAADIAAAGDHGYHHRTPPPQGATPGCGDSDGEDEAKGRAELKLKGGERQMEMGGRKKKETG